LNHLLVVLLMTVTWATQSFAQEPPQVAGRTHHFKPTQYYHTFPFVHAPALRIKPGDRGVSYTIDAGGRDETNSKVTEGGNPQTGPFFHRRCRARRSARRTAG
jgi:hypothetical protein